MDLRYGLHVSGEEDLEQWVQRLDSVVCRCELKPWSGLQGEGILLHKAVFPNLLVALESRTELTTHSK